MKKLFKGLTFITLLSILLVGCTANKQTKNEDLLNQIKKSGTLKVGLMGTYPPYNFMNNKNEVDGFDADISKEVAKRLGVKTKFVTNEWSGMVAGLQKGKFDAVISQMTITPERKKSMDFSTPYIKNSVNIIVKENNSSIKSISDFKDKKIGVGLGTNDETYLRQTVLPKVGNFEIVTYNDVSTALLDLNSGRIDATINNIFSVKPTADKNNLKIKTVGKSLKDDYAGIAIKKGNPELLKALNKTLKDMKADGTYKKIFVKWFGIDPNL